MPEMPEVESLRVFLTDRLVGRTITRLDVVAFSALKTYDPPPTTLYGLEIDGVSRHGKFLDISAQGVHLVFHLARAGWLRWKDVQPTAPPKAGRNPLAVRLHLDDGSGFDLTEAGTQRKLAVYVVTDPPRSRTWPPSAPTRWPTTSTGPRCGAVAKAGRSQLKGVLKDQRVIAGIGNAYSDEILHVARMSPFKPASSLSDEELTRLYDAIRTS